MKTQVFVAGLLMAGCASADVLFDTRPALSFGTGWTVGAASGFDVVQPFTVTEPQGWHLQRIWLDGWMVLGTGALKVDVRETDNGPTLASTSILMNSTNASASNFVSGDLDLNLAGGASYVIRVRMDNAGGWNALFRGSSGDHARSYDSSNTEFDDDTSISTYFEGNVAPSPAGMSLLGLGGLVATRRRR